MKSVIYIFLDLVKREGFKLPYKGKSMNRLKAIWRIIQGKPLVYRGRFRVALFPAVDHLILETNDRVPSLPDVAKYYTED